MNCRRSARAYYRDQAARLCAGAAVVIFAPFMWYPGLFKAFGWLVIITTAGLLLIPMAVAPSVRQMGDPVGNPTLEALCARYCRAGYTDPLRRVSCRALVKMAGRLPDKRRQRTRQGRVHATSNHDHASFRPQSHEVVSVEHSVRRRCDPHQ